MEKEATEETCYSGERRTVRPGHRKNPHWDGGTNGACGATGAQAWESSCGRWETGLRQRKRRPREDCQRHYLGLGNRWWRNVLVVLFFMLYYKSTSLWVNPVRSQLPQEFRKHSLNVSNTLLLKPHPQNAERGRVWYGSEGRQVEDQHVLELDSAPQHRNECP